MRREKTTVEYLSNLQYVDSSKPNDKNYMRFVHDPFSLEIMKKKIENRMIDYSMTPIQKAEMDAAAGHCAYAFKDDYPWGTVEVDGQKRVICKCIKMDCPMFSKCRSNTSPFSETEIIDNSIYWEKQKNDIDEFLEAGELFKSNVLGDKYDEIKRKESIEIYTHVNHSDDETDNTNVIEEIQPIELSQPIINIKQSDNIQLNIIDAEIDTLADVVADFEHWLNIKGFTELEISNYIKNLKRANMFARKKHIWEDDIFTVTNSIDSVSAAKEYLEKLINSPYYQNGMSIYNASIELFIDYLTEVNGNKDEHNETPISEEDSYRVEESLFEDAQEETLLQQGEGFEKFIVVDQNAVIKANPDDRIIVNAGPGTGKTYSLIERIIYLVNIKEVDPEEILILCFSRAAVEVITTRLKKAASDGLIGMNWHSIDIRTFDAFATSLLAYVADNQKELLYDNFLLEALDYDQRINQAVDVLKKDAGLIEQCSHLIVDEVQDLVTCRARLVMQLIEDLPQSSGYTLLGDACQSIYDYQCQDGEIDSVKFYNWLFNKQNKSLFYMFDVNYRQISSLEELGNKYRNEILVGDDNSRNKVSNDIIQNVDYLKELNLRDTSYDDLSKLKNASGTLGILTRTNGQALKISTWLRNADIPHRVQKRQSDAALNTWIADMFIPYANDTIDESTFIDIFNSNGGYGMSPEDVWNAIGMTQYESNNKYSVETILKGIVNNGRSSLFYNNGSNEDIIISNIHRSKGREFDSVVLLRDIFETDDENAVKDLLEHKVSYVGFTRAKEKIYCVDIPKQYIKTDKQGERRAYASKMNFQKKKSYLTHIEIGRAYDIDEKSFAVSSDIQELMEDPFMLIGERVLLKKNRELYEEKGYVVYDIYLEDNMQAGCIAHTSRKFYGDLRRIIKTIYNLPINREVIYDVYPYGFSDVYIDDVHTVIGKYDPMSVAAKRFGEYSIWRGISLIGFAQIDRDKY